MQNTARNIDVPLEKGIQMSVNFQNLLEEVKKLSADERIKLIKEILNSIEKERVQIDEAWAAEAESRLEAYEAGLIEGIPISKLFEEIKKKGEQ